MNHNGFKFNIEVRKKGFLNYSWTVSVEENGFLTLVAEGNAYGFNSGKKAAVGRARKWAKHQNANADEKERRVECETMDNNENKYRRSR